tara:strand:- start:955 stop:1287 length:333 start_codon:yes stop_codon:yes gene_type:complete
VRLYPIFAFKAVENSSEIAEINFQKLKECFNRFYIVISDSELEEELYTQIPDDIGVISVGKTAKAFVESQPETKALIPDFIFNMVSRRYLFESCLDKESKRKSKFIDYQL